MYFNASVILSLLGYFDNRIHIEKRISQCIKVLSSIEVLPPCVPNVAFGFQIDSCSAYLFVVQYTIDHH